MREFAELFEVAPNTVENWLSYEVIAPLMAVTYCHCSGFRLTESWGLKWHPVSPEVRRGFCADCGSSVLFDEISDSKMSICAGTLDEPTGIRERAHIFTGSQGDYCEISGDLPRYDTFPVRPVTSTS